MLRRDFLKFLGVCSAVVAMPVAHAHEPLTVEPRIPSDIHEMVRQGRGVLLDFHFENRSFTVYAEEGNFTWETFLTSEFKIVRGELEPASQASSLIAFSLDAIITWTDNADFVGHIRNHMPEFNMRIVLHDESQITLQGCLWGTIEHDMQSGAFSLRGRAKYATVIK